MKVIQIHPVNPQPRLVKQVAEVFQRDGVVVYPTDSGYSMGCWALSKSAKNRLYHIKREIEKYFMSLMVHDFSEIPTYAVVETSSYRYMKAKLPGHYTFILPATISGKKILEVKRAEIGVRMPDHPFFHVLNDFFHEPILNTSAKIHDDDALVEPEEIIERFGKQVDLVVDMGPIPLNPTAIVSLVTGAPEVIRDEGEVAHKRR